MSSVRGIESLAGDLCTVWVIGWLHSTLRIRDIVSLQTRSWVLRVSCDMRCYRQQRFKPFGLSDSVSCVRDTTGGRGSNPLVWLVFVQRPSFNARHYRWHRFKPCGLISACLRVLISASSRGSNPLACQTGFIWLLFLWISTGSHPVGLRSVWKLECVGSNPVAWVVVFWRVSA